MRKILFLLQLLFPLLGAAQNQSSPAYYGQINSDVYFPLGSKGKTYKITGDVLAQRLGGGGSCHCKDGRGVVSILKTSTSGLADQYTVLYTDSTTTYFTVKNGNTFNYRGTVPTYSDLLGTAVSPVVNDAWYVQADKKLYVYNGVSFPAYGQGIDLAITGNNLYLNPNKYVGYNDYSQVYGSSGLVMPGFVAIDRYTDTILQNYNISRVRTIRNITASPALAQMTFDKTVAISSKKYWYYQAIIIKDAGSTFNTSGITPRFGWYNAAGTGQNLTPSNVTYTNISANHIMVKFTVTMPDTFMMSRFIMGINVLVPGNEILRVTGESWYYANALDLNFDLVPSRLKEEYTPEAQLIVSSVKNYVNSADAKIYKDTESKKVVLLGTSIDQGGYFDKVADYYNIRYINSALSGSGIMWGTTPGKNDTLFENALGWRGSFSASKAEKEAYALANGVTFTSDQLACSWDQVFAGNLDADLFIIGTYGINDRKSGAASAFIIDKTTRKYDRTTIYGAYNYVLRKLFEMKPTANVIILGQHCYGWTGQTTVNEIQREVAKDWNITFLDWGYKLGWTEQQITISGSNTTVRAQYAPDGAHYNAAGKAKLSDFLIRALRPIL